MKKKTKNEIQKIAGFFLAFVLMVGSCTFGIAALSGALNQKKTLSKLKVEPKIGNSYYIPYKDEFGLFWYKSDVLDIRNDTVFFINSYEKDKCSMDRFKKMATIERGSNIF